MGTITALFGWFIWIFFIGFAAIAVGFLALVPPVAAIAFGITTINNSTNPKERRKATIGILMGITGPFIGWFALLFFLMLRNSRTR